MKNKKIQLPRLHLTCAYDEHRPVFNHVLITKEEVVATNTHVLVVFKTEYLFDDDFIQNMPERMLLHRKQWVKLSQPFLFLKFKNDFIEIHREGYTEYLKPTYENHVGKYPEYNLIWPEKKEVLDEIGINSSLLSNLEKIVFTHHVQRGFKFEFYGKYKSMLLCPIDLDVKCKILIMPTLLND